MSQSIFIEQTTGSEQIHHILANRSIELPLYCFVSLAELRTW